MVRTLISLLLIALASGCGGAGWIGLGSHGGFGGNPEEDTHGLRVSTWNVYYGADLTDAVMAVVAGDPEAMLMATTQAFAQVQATDFRTRAERIAATIAALDLDLVGLQEAALWRTQFPADTFGPEPTPAEDVAFDFVQILLDELTQLGVTYEVAASIDTFDAELPRLDETGAMEDVRITDREVILVRRRGAGAEIVIEASDAGLFGVYLELPGGFATPQGWVSVDAQYDGTPFRFVSTHLEADIVDIRLAQAAELLAGVAASPRPTILAGDLNSDALQAGSGGAPCYDMIVAGGFADALSGWTLLEGAGTATRGAGLADPLDVLTERLDAIFVRADAGLLVEDATLLGADATDFVGGLWPSDHAGVAVLLSRNVAPAPLP